MFCKCLTLCKYSKLRQHAGMKNRHYVVGQHNFCYSNLFKNVQTRLLEHYIIFLIMEKEIFPVALMLNKLSCLFFKSLLDAFLKACNIQNMRVHSHIMKDWLMQIHSLCIFSKKTILAYLLIFVIIGTRYVVHMLNLWCKLGKMKRGTSVEIHII